MQPSRKENPSAQHCIFTIMHPTFHAVTDRKFNINTLKIDRKRHLGLYIVKPSWPLFIEPSIPCILHVRLKIDSKLL